MALSGSGPISFSQIQTEFGGSNPISLSEYYRSGAYTTSNNTGVPTSGAISMSQFYGTSLYVADLIPAAIDINDVVSFTADGFGYTDATSNTVTITGVSETISITIDSTDIEANVFALGGGLTANAIFHVYVNGSYVAGTTWARANNGQTTGISKSMTFSVPNNGTIYVFASLELAGFVDGDGGTSGTFSVKNASSGNTVLDTFALSLSASITTV